MRFGVSFLPDADPSTKLAQDYFRDALALAEFADEAGLHFIKMTEHCVQPYGGYYSNPLSFLSAIAARTRQIRLLRGGILPVFHHPLQIASEAAMLDAISGGRAEIGFARAYMPYEFKDSAKAMRERHAAIVGSPAHVIEQINQLRSELGVETILWQIDFGAMPGEEARRTLTLFVEKVWPSVL